MFDVGDRDLPVPTSGNYIFILIHHKVAQ